MPRRPPVAHARLDAVSALSLVHLVTQHGMADVIEALAAHALREDTEIAPNTLTFMRARVAARLLSAVDAIREFNGNRVQNAEAGRVS